MKTELCKRNLSTKKWLLIVLLKYCSVPFVLSQTLFSQTLPGTLKNGYGSNRPMIDRENQKNIVYEETQTGGSSGTAAVTTFLSLTGISDDLYLAVISTRSNVPVRSVAGLGLNWTRIITQCSARSQTGLELWMAQGIPMSSGNVTAYLDGIAENAVIAVSRYSGVDPRSPIGTVIAGNTLGPNGGNSGGRDKNSYSFNTDTSIPGTVIYGTAALRNCTHLPGPDYKERAEISKGIFDATTGLAVQDQLVPSASAVALNGAFDRSVDWAVIGVEIKPYVSDFRSLTVITSGFGSVFLDPASGIYPGGTRVKLKAIPAAGNEFGGWSEALSGASKSDSVVVNSDRIITAKFVQSAPKYSLAIETLGSGHVALDPPGGIYDANSIVTLTAISDSGYKFVGWGKDLSGASASVNILMNGHKKVVANFALLTIRQPDSEVTGQVQMESIPAEEMKDAPMAVKTIALPESASRLRGKHKDFNSIAVTDSLRIDSLQEELNPFVLPRLNAFLDEP